MQNDGLILEKFPSKYISRMTNNDRQELFCSHHRSMVRYGEICLLNARRVTDQPFQQQLSARDDLVTVVSYSIPSFGSGTTFLWSSSHWIWSRNHWPHKESSSGNIYSKQEICKILLPPILHHGYTSRSDWLQNLHLHLH